MPVAGVYDPDELLLQPRLLLGYQLAAVVGIAAADGGGVGIEVVVVGVVEEEVAEVLGEGGVGVEVRGAELEAGHQGLDHEMVEGGGGGGAGAGGGEVVA